MKKDDKDNYFLHNLLSIPKKNLESKLKDLAEQQSRRQQLSDEIMSNLLTHKLTLKHLHHRLRYQPNDILKQISQTDMQIHKETVACFEDIGEFKSKINLLQEELALSSIKFKLLEDENSN